MTAVLHRAIKDAIKTTAAYEEKSILVSQVLEATADVAGQEHEVYDAVHRLFTLMPARLVRGSVFLVTTQDVDHGVELTWDAREEPRPGFEPGQGLLSAYEAGEPIARALRELERVCETRAGYVRASYEQVANSSSFPRRPYLHRRVVAHLPLSRKVAEERARQRLAQANAPTNVDVHVTTKPEREPGWRALWPQPLAPVPRVGARKR